MVVTVVTANSTDGLDRYLTVNGVSTSAAKLIALTPYLGQQDEYALVCGWLAKSGQELTARAVRVDFSTPAIFYPLQPTRVYESKIPTVVYIRGMVRPTAGLAVPGVQCQYLRGAVEEVNLGYSLATSERSSNRKWHPPPEATLEPLTRVEVTSAPSSWTDDLVLEPQAPAAIEVACIIDRGGLPLLWGLSTVLGMLLSVFLPWAILPRENRRWTDWLWAAAVGAATGLSVWVSTLLFLAWNARRFPGQVLGLGASGIILILIFVLAALLAIKDVGVFFVAGVGLLLLGASCLAGLVYLLARTGDRTRATWFGLFMLAHGCLACLFFFVLRQWLSAYG
jgi:hypothetical protein